MATRNRIATLIAPCFRHRGAFTAASAALALGLLAASPAWGTGPAAAAASQPQAAAAPRAPGRFATLVKGLATHAANRLDQAAARISVKRNLRSRLLELGRAGKVVGANAAELREFVKDAVLNHGASEQAAGRSAWRAVDAAGRAPLRRLGRELRQAAKALSGPSGAAAPAEDDVARPGEAFEHAHGSYYQQVADLGAPAWGALSYWDAVGVRRTLEEVRQSLGLNLDRATGRQEPDRIADALALAADFRALNVEHLGDVKVRRPGARLLSPKGRGEPLVEAGRHAFGVDRVWSALEATREGELRVQFTEALATRGATLRALVDSDRGLAAVSEQVGATLGLLDSTYTQALTGKALDAHYLFGGGKRRMNKVIEEIAPRALRAMLQGLVLRATPMTPDEAAMIEPLMLEATGYRMPRALNTELNRLRDQVLKLGVDET